MTQTSIKRHKFSARFARKDARTAIYKVLYGKQEHDRSGHRGKRSNIPSTDDSRSLNLVHWNYDSSKATLDINLPAAHFTPEQTFVLLARLESLKAAHRRAVQSKTVETV